MRLFERLLRCRTITRRRPYEGVRLDYRPHGGATVGSTETRPLVRPHHKPAVWLSGVVIFVATVTIASIPSREPFPQPPVDGLVVTPPRQVIALTDIDGEVHRTEIPGLYAAPPSTKGSVTESRDTKWTSITVRRGDTLSGMLARLKLADGEIRSTLQTHPDARLLYHLTPGQTLKVLADPATGALQELIYFIDDSDGVRLRRTTTGIEVTRESRQFEMRPAYVTGHIDSSLFVDGQIAGLSDALIMQLVEIFGWDIDFALDLRVGDRFAVIHEEKTWRGQKLGDGSILAAEFVNRGRRYRAIGYRDAHGRIRFYSPEGMSMRRAFLRTPVELSRITSRFSRGRFHPILKRWRAHTGVDYGAPTGTPVRATAAGRILHVGRKGGYGNTVVLRHGGSYSTLYAHLSRYRHGLRAGGYVEQGQIIGYVGSTGLATGPHLHYEFQVDGSHRDPLTFEFPQAEPIPAEYRKEFLAQAKGLESQLNLIAPNAVTHKRTASAVVARAP